MTTPVHMSGQQRRLARGASSAAVALLCLSGSAACRAQEPMVRTSFDPAEKSLLIGQKGTLVVELLAPGYFSGAPAFDLPNISGAVLVPPTGSPVISSQDVDGASYTAQRHEVAVIFHRPGQQTVPPFHVRFAFKRAPLDKDAVAADLTTGAISVSVAAPPEAENLPGLICANDLSVDEQWSPEPGDAKVGDAFTRTITFSAGDVPGMAFPPFPTGAINGVRSYRQEPQVLDESNRGQLVGIRRETVVYVCQRPGQATIPAVRLTWWDLDDAELKTVDLPARNLRVAANPAPQQGATARPTTIGNPARPARGLSSTALAKLIAAILCVAGLVWLAVRRHLLLQVGDYFRPVRLCPLNPLRTPHPPSQESSVLP